MLYERPDGSALPVPRSSPGRIGFSPSNHLPDPRRLAEMDTAPRDGRSTSKRGDLAQTENGVSVSVRAVDAPIAQPFFSNHRQALFPVHRSTATPLPLHSALPLHHSSIHS